MNKVAFMFAVNQHIGVGHAMRSMVLARALLNNAWRVDVIVNADAVDFMPALSEFNVISNNEFYHSDEHYDLLVIDDYRVTLEEEKKIAACTNKLMVIDDLANRKHHCDFLLDQNYLRIEDDYSKLVSEHCKFFLGSNYALLREEFSQLRERSLQKKKKIKEIQKILINFGGVDQKNYTSRVLSKILQSEYTGELHIVLGFSSPFRQQVEKISKQLANKVVLYDQANMAELMFEVDFCIGAPGSTSWERACLGLPSMLVQIADNQSVVMDAFAKDGIAFLVDKDLNTFHKVFSPILTSKDPYQSMVEKSSQICDGKGVTRIVDYLNGDGL